VRGSTDIPPATRTRGRWVRTARLRSPATANAPRAVAFATVFVVASTCKALENA